MMKKLTTLFCAAALTLSAALMASAEEKKPVTVPKAPPAVKQGNLKPNQPKGKVTDSSKQQNKDSEEKKNSNSDFGKKKETKEEPSKGDK